MNARVLVAMFALAVATILNSVGIIALSVTR